MTVVGLGVVGAGRFGTFVAESVADLPDLEVRAVTDVDAALSHRMADAHGSRTYGRYGDLVEADDVDVVLVATPPATHAEVALAALGAGRSVMTEKPLATTADDALAVASAAEHSAGTLLVDHVLRYNPLVRAMVALREAWLGPVQRLCFENDASDEHLAPSHWFWDAGVSGGILVEHGVHFFDLGSLLVGSVPSVVQAIEAHRPDGTVDLVCATALHEGGALASYAHSFTHADRCERQHLRIDHGAAEVRVEGWVPIDVVVDAWTDDAGADLAEALPSRWTELAAVPGHRLAQGADCRTQVRRDALPAPARGRGAQLDLPHHVVVEITLGGPSAKQHVYRECVRAAMTDLLDARATGRAPVAGALEGLAAVLVADAARRAAATGTTVTVPSHTSRTTSTPVETLEARP